MAERDGSMKEILQAHGFTFKKSLGQNFITDPHVCPRMADASGAAKGVGVLEIGPGMGVLTKELAKRAEKVVAIELDDRLLPVLDETLKEYENAKVIHGDAMTVDLAAILEEEFAGLPVVVCANLPYYITSPVIMRLLESNLSFEQITVMVQKEAADRLAAEPGSRECGAVSVAIAYYAKAEKCFGVPRGCFFPAPNVDSAVIALKLHKQPPVSVQSEKLFFQTVKAAFAQRRKTVLNSISSSLGISKDLVSSALGNAGISATARAESLTLKEYALLADALFSLWLQK